MAASGLIDERRRVPASLIERDVSAEIHEY
jgi:hypothetical protein